MNENHLVFSGGNVPIALVAKVMKKRQTICKNWYSRKMVADRCCI